MSTAQYTTTEQKNVELVQQAYEAFKSKDIQTILNTVAENVEWIVPGPKSIPFAGNYKGRDQVKQFFGRLAEATDLQTFEPKEYFANGNKVVALGFYAGKVRSTNRHVETQWSMAFTFNDGKISYFREYLDTASLAEAFRA